MTHQDLRPGKRTDKAKFHGPTVHTGRCGHSVTASPHWRLAARSAVTQERRESQLCADFAPAGQGAGSGRCGRVQHPARAGGDGADAEVVVVDQAAHRRGVAAVDAGVVLLFVALRADKGNRRGSVNAHAVLLERKRWNKSVHVTNRNVCR